MSEQAQVGDTVRLMVPIVGVVKPEYGGSVRGCSIHGDDGRTVEILSRATLPLPNKPGTFWADMSDELWKVDKNGKLLCCSYPELPAKLYGPFRQLVLR